MPIFPQTLQVKDTDTEQVARKKIINHIKQMQEQLEYLLYNLDSRNITEIDTDKTTITDSTGSTSIGSYIHLTGANGESFTVGKNAKGQFEFVVKGKGGTQTLHLDSSGNLIITGNANLTINGGKW